jgi:predicted dinucleotide-utilizing enzyme
MAWKPRRNGRRYYYRSRRVGDRIVTDYLGSGQAGELAAVKDAAKREARLTVAAARHTERQRFSDLDEAFADLDTVVETLTRAALTAAGYHQHHRGEWRKRRG